MFKHFSPPEHRAEKDFSYLCYQHTEYITPNGMWIKYWANIFTLLDTSTWKCFFSHSRLSRRKDRKWCRLLIHVWNNFFCCLYKKTSICCLIPPSDWRLFVTISLAFFISVCFIIWHSSSFLSARAVQFFNQAQFSIVNKIARKNEDIMRFLPRECSKWNLERRKENARRNDVNYSPWKRIDSDCFSTDSLCFASSCCQFCRLVVVETVKTDV